MSCERRQIVIRASVKFDSEADGPIIFLTTRNDEVAFSLEVDSDIKPGTIKIGFIHDRETYGLSFNHNFNNLTEWHDVIVSFDGRLVSVYVDCERVGDRVVLQPDYCLPPYLNLTIGNNPQRTQFFKASIS